MFGSRKKQKPSLFRRLFYLFMLLGGGGGAGGWALQDHPQIQALLTMITGEDAATLDSIDANTVEAKLATAVAGAIKKSRDEFSRPGVYQVAIEKVHLDPALFKAGHTVDVQARVIKLDPGGRDATLWESKPYGDRLAVAGKDELTVGWPHRPFQVPWSPGDQVVVEVYDSRPGIFAEPKRFALAPPSPAARDFPLKSGTFPLIPARKTDPTQASRDSQIEFQSARIGDLDGKNSTQVAERPIVIK